MNSNIVRVRTQEESNKSISSLRHKIFIPNDLIFHDRNGRVLGSRTVPMVIQQWIVNHDHVSAERDVFTERRTPLLIHGSTRITRD